MWRLAAITAIGALSVVVGAQAVISVARDHPLPVASAVDTPVFAHVQAIEAAPATGQDAEVPKGPDGHYWAEALVGGHQVRFLVDTGASAVALTPEDAQRVGFDPNSLTYAYTVTTASGHAPAARVQLASVAVAGAEVDNVDAYVIQNGLEHSLLGMSYLGRLSQFEATQSSLILRP